MPNYTTTVCMKDAGEDMSNLNPAQGDIVRQFCMALPGVVEEQTLQHIAFKVGHRPFVVIETFQSTAGVPYNCLAFKASFFDHEKLSVEPEFFPAPYLGSAGWLGCRLDGQEDGPDLDRLFSALSRSHRQIAGRSASSTRNARRLDEVGD